MQTTLQKSELIRLINQGFPFEIEVKTEKRKPGIFGYFQKREVITETRSFKIKEPTLHTLDRIALESMEIDTEKYKDEPEYSNYITKNSRLHYKIMAKIIAIAVAENESEEPELEKIFFQCLKPSEVSNIIQLIDITSNLADFMNSTLLVTAAKAHQAKMESVEKEKLPD